MPVSEADSTMYYDTDVSMTSGTGNDGNISSHNDQDDSIPHTNVPTGLVQANDSTTVSTITEDDAIQLPSPTSTVHNQLSTLSEAKEEELDHEEEEDQYEIPQTLEHDVESTSGTTQAEDE